MWINKEIGPESGLLTSKIFTPLMPSNKKQIQQAREPCYNIAKYLVKPWSEIGRQTTHLEKWTEGVRVMVCGYLYKKEVNSSQELNGSQAETERNGEIPKINSLTSLEKPNASGYEILKRRS